MKLLEEMARDMVGDGQRPNLYFVTLHGRVIAISTRQETARAIWAELPRDEESAVEDRLNGVICSTEPREDGRGWIRYDDTQGHCLIR